MPLHSHQILIEIGRDHKRLLQVLPIQGFVSINSQLSCGSEDISNLTTIQLFSGKIVKTELNLVKVDILLVFLEHVQEVVPNLFPSGSIEIFVMQCNLNSRLEGFVKRTDTIAR